MKGTQDSSRRGPAGFTPQSSGLASEYARELGWGINEDERTRTAEEKQDADGGNDYEYGPRDFGDSATDTSAAQPSRDSTQPIEPHHGPTRSKPLHKPPRKSR